MTLSYRAPKHFSYDSALMKPYQIAWMVACLIIAGCHSHSAHHSAAPPVRLTDDEQLREASHEWDRLFNGGDWAGLAQLYAVDAISMPPEGPMVQGRAAIERELQSFLSSNVARHDTTVIETFARGDLAVEVGTYRMVYRPRVGGPEIVESGRHMQTRRKIDGRWLIVAEIWNLDPPAKK
jgi:ketosteroid isomerase-like protein